jgi:hypothetical protein
MNPTFTYYPDKGFSLANIPVNWGDSRQNVRHLLGEIYEIHDSDIDMSEYHDGNPDFNLFQGRDVYTNYGAHDNFFFLNYDVQGYLIEVEIHHGLDILVNNVKLIFGTDFLDSVKALKAISDDNKKTGDGEYFFNDLKLIIADWESRGGDENFLAYFYCAKDVTHLSNE